MSLIDEMAKEKLGGEEETDSKELRNPVLQLLKEYEPMASAVKDPIVMLTIPTIYGNLIFVDFTHIGDEVYASSTREKLSNSGLMMLPVDFTTIKLDNQAENDDGDEDADDGEVYCFDAKYKGTNKISYAIILPDQKIQGGFSFHYILPMMAGVEKNLGAVASGLSDFHNAVVSMQKYNDESGINRVELPKKGLKVTKPNMTCKGNSYELNTLYLMDGEIVLHKRGFHYATTPSVLKTWYKNSYMDNEVYAVQAGSVNLRARDGVNVTNGLLVMERMSWNTVDKIKRGVISFFD